VSKNPADVTSKLVYEYVAKGDALALKVHNRACDMLGRAVGIIMNTLTPDRVVLGGGVMMAGEVILEAVKKYTAKYCWPAIYERCEIVPAQMSEDAGVMGAGALAFEEFGKKKKKIKIINKIKIWRAPRPCGASPTQPFNAVRTLKSKSKPH
jgi:glucokinase